jgi:hypothetical protein
MPNFCTVYPTSVRPPENGATTRASVDGSPGMQGYRPISFAMIIFITSEVPP